MSSSSLLCFLLVKLFLLISIFQYSAKSEEGNNANYGDGGAGTPSTCNNCTICQFPCHPQAPPPATGYQPYGGPPPPVAQTNCPPAAPVQCCGGGGQNYAPPSPFYYPYSNYSGAAIDVGAQISRFHVALSLFYYFVM